MSDHEIIKYGSRVVIRDGSGIDGFAGLVIKVGDDSFVEVLLEKEVVWPVNINELELVS